MDENDHLKGNISDNTLTLLDDSSHESSYYNDQSCFEASEFFELNDWIGDDDPTSMVLGYPQASNFAENGVVKSSGSSVYHGGHSSRDNMSNKTKKDVKERVAFRTMSQTEILNDGFKWRKYGKKMVKDSPNPRNYYKCSAEGCPVKKRVERDNEDPRYVITTYEGIHTHPGPNQI